MLTIQMLLAENPPARAVTTADDDMVLVKRAQKDLATFSELYHRHVNRIYRYLLVRVGNEQDAQDLTSQTFLAAMENIGKYRGPQPFVAWLFGIARHKEADLFRRHRPEVVLETAVNMPDGIDQEELVSRQLQLELVARKLQKIAPDRAEVLTLRLFGGLEVPEIAHMVSKNEAAVRMLVHRGLRDLQDQLNPGREAQA